MEVSDGGRCARTPTDLAGEKNDNGGCASLRSPASAGKLSLAEDQHLGEGQGVRMRDGEKRRSAADLLEADRGTAVQLQPRRPAAPDHLDVTPEDALRMT